MTLYRRQWSPVIGSRVVPAVEAYRVHMTMAVLAINSLASGGDASRPKHGQAKDDGKAAC